MKCVKVKPYFSLLMSISFFCFPASSSLFPTLTNKIRRTERKRKRYDKYIHVMLWWGHTHTLRWKRNENSKIWALLILSSRNTKEKSILIVLWRWRRTVERKVKNQATRVSRRRNDRTVVIAQSLLRWFYGGLQFVLLKFDIYMHVPRLRYFAFKYCIRDFCAEPQRVLSFSSLSDFV